MQGEAFRGMLIQFPAATRGLPAPGICNVKEHKRHNPKGNFEQTKLILTVGKWVPRCSSGFLNLFCGSLLLYLSNYSCLKVNWRERVLSSRICEVQSMPDDQFIPGMSKSKKMLNSYCLILQKSATCRLSYKGCIHYMLNPVLLTTQLIINASQLSVKGNYNSCYK